MKKTISMVLAVLMLTALLCSCGNSGYNKNLAVDDFADSSAEQQGWLRLPDSSLVINPDEYQGNTSNNKDRLGLNLGILDENGNVTKSLNDLVFIVENKSANGVGGETIWSTADADDIGSILRWGLKATVQGDAGTFTATTSGTPSSAINFMKRLSGVDLSKELVAVLDVSKYNKGEVFVKDDEETEPGWGFSASVAITHPDGKENVSINAQASTEDEGKFVYYFSDTLRNNATYELSESTGQLNCTFGLYGEGTSVVVSEYKIVQFDKGFQYATEAAKTTWYLYAIVSDIAYPNGTKVQTTDYFANYSTVARKITLKDTGLMTLAGKVEGTLTYDSLNNVMVVEGDGYSYVVAPKKKLDITFYNSEADMLAGKYGTTEPTSSTEYWTVYCGSTVQVDSDIYIAVSLDASKDVETLIEETVAPTKSNNTKARFERTKEWWNQYIHVYELPDTYILNVPNAD